MKEKQRYKQIQREPGRKGAEREGRKAGKWNNKERVLSGNVNTLEPYLKIA